MRTEGGASERLIAVFLGGCIAFGYPLLALFNVPATLFGVPVLYLYLFGAWAALILAIGIILRRGP